MCNVWWRECCDERTAAFAAGVRVVFWEGVRAGLARKEAGRAAGVWRERARRWMAEAGGVISNGAGPVSGRFCRWRSVRKSRWGRRRAKRRQIAGGAGAAAVDGERELARNSGRGWSVPGGDRAAARG